MAEINTPKREIAFQKLLGQYLFAALVTDVRQAAEKTGGTTDGLSDAELAAMDGGKSQKIKYPEPSKT